MTGVEDAQATFTEIADAIRGKTGKTAGMKITEMAAEIESISTDTRVSLTVTVRGASGVLSGATVTASFSGGSDMTATTNASGVATFSVKPGYDYSVSASKTGFITTSAKTVHVDAEGASDSLTMGAKPVVTVTQTGGTGAVTVTGGTYTANGNVYTLDSPGTTYTFAVAQVALHVKPANQTVNLAADGTQTLTFTHTAYPTVTVGQTGATTAVTCTPTAAAQSSNVYTLVPNTSYTFSVAQASGYFKPVDQTVSYDAGTTNSITFAHLAKPVLTVTVTGEGHGGLTVEATNGTDTQTGTTNASGVATIMLNGTGEYSVTVTNPPSGASSSTATVTATAGGTPSCTVELSYGFSGCVGVVIDESTSDCNNMVSYDLNLSTGQGIYTNAANGATPMSGAGSSFNIGSWGTGNLAKFIEDIKPVAFDGTTWTDLAKTSETDWPTDRDIFTEFPFRWLSITKSGSKITVVFAGGDTAPDSTFQDWAFLGADGTTRRSNFHLGCYTASGSTSGVYSKKGTSNLVSTALNQYWVAASKRGTEYDCLPYQMWVYLQCLFLVLYKSTNCQTTHSKGYSGGSSVQTNSAFADYGNSYGMYGSTSSSTTQNAFFWLHNLWGNMYQFSASVFVRAGSTKAIYYCLSAMSRSSNWDNSSWNNTSTSYRAKQTNIGVASGSTGKDVNSYYTKACGSNGAGFLPASDSGTGSATTYFPGYGYVYSRSSYAYFANLGGYYDNGDACGLFNGSVNYSSTGSHTYCGSRLAYRGGRA